MSLFKKRVLRCLSCLSYPRLGCCQSRHDGGWEAKMFFFLQSVHPKRNSYAVQFERKTLSCAGGNSLGRKYAKHWQQFKAQSNVQAKLADPTPAHVLVSLQATTELHFISTTSWTRGMNCT